nr:immunoglobulin heavy chain junction region [Mus musculus]MBK4189385.1 immunoglobulin heavy chain junction region [Mus musculus]MBK4189386.1 immunoglobulin heavy chain junction region [Mus musculus]
CARFYYGYDGPFDYW